MPDPGDATTLAVTCTCGKPVRMSISAAGRMVACLACGRDVKMPELPGPRLAPPPVVGAGVPSKVAPPSPVSGTDPAGFKPPSPEAAARFQRAIDGLRNNHRDPVALAAAGDAANTANARTDAFMYYQRAIQLDPSRIDLIRKLNTVASNAEQAALARKWAERPPTFLGSLEGLLLYPFRGHGIAILLLGGALMFGIRLLTKFSLVPFAAWMAGAILTAYLASFFLSILNTSAIGDDDLPQWPDLTDFGSLFVDLWKFTVAWLVSFAPVFLVLLFLLVSLIRSCATEDMVAMPAPPDSNFEFAPPPPSAFDAPEFPGTDPGLNPGVPPEASPMPDLSQFRVPTAPAPSAGKLATLGLFALLGILVCVVFIPVGMVYFPMAVTANAVFGFPFACINPAFIFRSIWATRMDYLLCVGTLFLIAIGTTILEFLSAIGGIIFFPMAIASTFITMYTYTVQMRLLGLFFRYNQVKLGWLTGR